MTVVQPHLQWGVAALDGDRVTGFVEKPRSEHWLNGGCLCFEPGALTHIEEDSVLEREPLQALAGAGQLRAFRHDGFWDCMDTYVDDAISAYLAIESAVGAGGPAAEEAFNAGGARPHSVAEVLETIAVVSGGGLDPEYHGTGNPAGEIDRQYVDSAKLRGLTGWQPAVELDEGLGRTLEWFRNHEEARP